MRRMKNGVIKFLSFRIAHRGRELHIACKYKDSAGPLLLFIHGLGCNKESFDDAFVDPFFGGFQLLAPDLIGYGDSSKPQDFSYVMEDQAEVLGMVLEDFSFGRIHVVAHSMGCAVGLLLAEKIRDKVASFTNAEGNLIAEDCGLISRKTIEIPFEEFRNSVFDKFRGKGPRPWRELSAKADALAFHKSCESLVEWSDGGKLLQIFQKLQAKKLYLYGDQNSDMKILGRLGDIKTIAIPDSGHFMMNDNPAEFYRQIRRLIS
jgi:pimeloyl-ACP methyl ester carboxylesterase